METGIWIDQAQQEHGHTPRPISGQYPHPGGINSCLKIRKDGGIGLYRPVTSELSWLRVIPAVVLRQM